MLKKKRPTKNDLLRPMTMGDLGAFAEEVILPGVERIVEEELDGLQADMKSGFSDLKEGIKDIHNSIKVLSGEIAELKVREEDQRHEGRIGRIERRVGIARP
jgi:hypothetical protein